MNPPWWCLSEPFFWLIVWPCKLKTVIGYYFKKWCIPLYHSTKRWLVLQSQEALTSPCNPCSQIKSLECKCLLLFLFWSIGFGNLCLVSKNFQTLLSNFWVFLFPTISLLVKGSMWFYFKHHTRIHKWSAMCKSTVRKVYKKKRVCTWSSLAKYVFILYTESP